MYICIYIYIRDLYFFKNYLFHSYICVCFQLVSSENICATRHAMRLKLTHVGL